MKKAATPIKRIKQAHSSNDKMGSGDYYGTGIKNKTGKMIRSYDVGSISSPPKLSKAGKFSLA